MQEIILDLTAPSAYSDTIQKTKYYIGKQYLMPSKFSNIRMMRNKNYLMSALLWLAPILEIT
jgi:hypothetical protein